MSLLAAISSSCLGVVFLVSAGSKLFGSVQPFVESLRNTGLLARGLVRPVAGVVVVSEAAVPLMMLFGPSRLAGHMGAGALLAAFSVGVAVVLARGTRVGCACFGAPRAMLTPLHLWRNVALLMLSLGGVMALLWGEARPGLVPGVACGAVLGLLVARLDDIHDLLRPAPRRDGL